MIAVVDFNHTVYDSNQFLKDFQRALGIGAQDFYEAMVKPYNVFTHAENIANLVNFQPEWVEKALKRALRGVPKMVYKDALKFLKKYPNKKILLTRGEKETQEFFIEKTKVKKYFDDIVIVPTEQGKVDFIADLAKDQKILFLNDYPEETKMVLEAEPNIEAVLVEREKGSFPKIEPINGVRIVKELTELL